MSNSTGLAKQTHPDDVPAGAVSPSPFLRGAIERATDLGGGYMIVKIAAPDAPAASNEAHLPVVPRNQVRKLLERFSEEGKATPARPRVIRSAPEDNTALLDQLQDAALALRQRLHDDGELLTSAQICARLGISRQALSKAVRDRRRFWIDGIGGAQWYPGFFADASLGRREVERVSVALADLPGAMKWQFFTTPKHSLEGRTPVETLKEGKSEDVVRAALEIVERSLGR